MGRGRNDPPPSEHEYTPVQEQEGAPLLCNDNSIKVQELIKVKKKGVRGTAPPLGIELDCAPLSSNVNPTLIQVQGEKRGRLNKPPLTEPDCTPDRAYKPISDVVGGESEEGEGDVIPPPMPFSDVVGCGPGSEPDENYHYTESYACLGARKDERDHEDGWEDDIPTDPSSYNDYLKGYSRARGTLSAPLPATPGEGEGANAPQTPGDLSPDFLDADEMAPGFETAPAKPEIADDFSGLDTGIGSGSEGEEVGHAPDQLFQERALAEPGRRASRVEVADKVYARNLCDFNSDVSDADDEESYEGAAAAHEMLDYDDSDSDISDEMLDYDDYDSDISDSDYDGYDSEVDVFSFTDSEYEEKIPSYSDLKLLHLSDVVLRPENNHAQNTIVSGPTAGFLARGPTPGPEPTPTADRPTQPAPVPSRRRTPLPGGFIAKILFIMLLCGGVMTTVDGHLPVNVNRHVTPGCEHAPLTAPAFAWSPVINSWQPNQCRPWRPPPPNRPPPFTHLRESHWQPLADPPYRSAYPEHIATPTAPRATTSGPTLPATEPNRQPQPPHRPAQQRRGSHAPHGKFRSRLIPGLIVIASVIGNTHVKQARVGRAVHHRYVGRPRVGTPPALSSDAAIRTQAKLLQEPRTLYFPAEHELWYTSECKATEMCLVCHVKRWEKATQEKRIDQENIYIRHLVCQWKANANVRIHQYKRGMLQSGNICFVIVFCIEYSAMRKHMQSLIYLYAFPVFSYCKPVYFCQGSPM